MTTDKTTDFAYACTVLNSVDELELAIKDGPDQADMDAWGIDEEEWVAGIKLAIAKLQQD